MEKWRQLVDRMSKPFYELHGMRDLALIGVACGWGARDPGCEDGPQAVFASGPVTCLTHDGQNMPAYEMVRAPLPPTGAAVFAAVVEINHRLADKVGAAVRAGHFPVVIGGDHSCAVGTWSGVRAARPADASLGLLWVDAHMDSHVPATSPSGALHGMPLACLLGEGHDELVHLAGAAPKLQPEHVCLFGVRSYEPGEAALLQRLGVKVIFMEAIARHGFAAMWREALAHVARAGAYGITIDLDAVDPRDAPGVGTPSSGGIGGDELVHALTDLHHDPHLLALEIAEYNPHHDRDSVTLRLLRRMLCAVGVGKEHDEPHDRARREILRP